MTLILQCAVCGTYHPVGTTICSTCRATGVQNLRLLFECPTCFRLDLTPTCGVCQPPAQVLPYEVVEDPEEADEFIPATVVTDEEAVLDLDPDEFELSLDDDDELLRLDDDDSSIEVD